MYPATKLKEWGSKLVQVTFAAVWATCNVSLIKIGPVDAVEFHPIIEDFD